MSLLIIFCGQKKYRIQHILEKVVIKSRQPGPHHGITFLSPLALVKFGKITPGMDLMRHVFRVHLHSSQWIPTIIKDLVHCLLCTQNNEDAMRSDNKRAVRKNEQLLLTTFWTIFAWVRRFYFENIYLVPRP